MNHRFCLLLLALLSVTIGHADEIRMVASDLLAEIISPPLKKAAVEKELDFKIKPLGTLPALDRLRAGEIDLAVIAIPDGEEIPRDEFRIRPFAYDVAVIAVNASNPINEISKPDLAGIFGSGEQLNFNSWGELGLAGWGTRTIKPLLGVAEQSIALELFRHEVLLGGSMKPSVSSVREAEIEETLSRNISSVGILSRVPENKKLKILMISETGENDSPAYGPTVENIHVGDYPLRLPFYLAYKVRDEQKLEPIVRALLGSDVAAALNKNNFFALPENVRNQLPMSFDFQQK